MIDINNFDENLSRIAVLCDDIDDDGARKLRDFVNEAKDNLSKLKHENSILKIGVVGQVKAGKSSFLNSLIFNGENILPKASTPMTAGLTMLQYADNNSFEVEYYNTNEWEDFEGKAAMYRQGIEETKQANPGMSDDDARQAYESKTENAVYVSANELVQNCKKEARAKISDISQKDTESFTDAKDLARILENYVGAEGEFTSVVKCLVINLNDQRLKDLQIVDTPGVNDPVISREERTKAFLGGCHGVFFLSFSGRFFDSTDVDFLDNRIGAGGIGSVVMVASKFDSALQDVAAKYDNLGNAVEHVQNALRKQFNSNFDTSEYKRSGGNKPEIYFSSGIGYSISHKPESEWDATESHVVNQMKEYFKGYFDTSDDVKANFNALSSIDEIRTNCLEKKFRKNKERIIAEKSDKYLKYINSELRKRVNNLLEKIKANEDSVKNAEGVDLEERRNLWIELVSSIIEDLSSVANQISSQTGKIETEIKNAWQFTVKVQPNSIVNDTRFKCHVPGLLWGTNIRNVIAGIYKLPQLSATESELLKALPKIESVAETWKIKCEPLSEIIRETITKAIEEAEKKDSQGKLNARVLYNIVNETIEEMFNVTTLDVSGLKATYQYNVEKFVIDFTPKNVVKIPVPQKKDKSFDEAALNTEIRRQAQQIIGEAQMLVNALTHQLQLSLNNKLRESREAVQNLLTTKRADMEERIKRSADKYLAQLQREIAEYQRDKEAMDEKFRVQNGNINTIKQLL